MDNRENPKQRVLWSFPWGYKEGIFFAVGFQMIGSLLELVFPFCNFALLKFPLTLACLFILLLLPVVSRFFWSNNPHVVWLSSVKASVPAIVLFSFNVLLLAIFPQQYSEAPLGLNHVTRTWYFAFAVVFVLVALSFAVTKRLSPFTKRNIAFTVSHIGLWLCVAAGLFGAGDKIEVKMQVARDQLVWYGVDDKGVSMELPIAIRLEKFSADFYAPKPAIIIKEGEATFLSRKDPDISKDTSFKIKNYNIRVLRFLQRAYPADSGFIDARGVPYAAPAALVEVENKSGEKSKGWIASQCAIFPESHIVLSPDTILALLPAEPKYFASDILLYTKRGIAAQKHRIEVNSPLKVEGWYIYQYGYDSRSGVDSSYSIFLAVYDPWLPLIYVGMVMMLFGVAWMLVLYVKKV